MAPPRPSFQATDAPARPCGGVRSAFAALAALILSMTAVASVPQACAAESTLVRVVMVGDLRDAMRSPAAPSAEPGSVAPRAHADASHPRAALALRATVMLRHTALPPPGC